MTRSAGCLILLMLGLLLASGASTVLYAEDLTPAVQSTNEPRRLSLTVGKSVVVDTAVPITRASLASPDIADALVLSPKQLYVTGKSAGVTSLTLWQDNEKVFAIYDIEVSPDLGRLKEHLHQLLKDEKDIQVTAGQDRVTLSGRVSNAANLAQVLSLAESYAPKKVTNLLQVGGIHQVMLEVRVAEMNRELLRRLGLNFQYVHGNQFAVGALNNLTTLVKPSDSTLATLGGPYGTAIAQGINALFRIQKGSSSWTGFIDALKQNNLVKIMAEPTLIALSGQQAQFLAGGEFPVPVPQAFGVVTIQYKSFGVGLAFTPTVLGQNKISMTVSPEVSELDFANAITLQGFLVPAITTRRAATTIELADGQSFAIAGLLRETVREQVAKYPVLGDIPILGALFRSSSFQKNETELIIIVTPRLVKPLDLTKQTLPTGQFIEPNDFEFYLMGQTESSQVRRGSVVSESEASESGRTGRLEGDSGHVVR
jgi:pilus assembly protein CpaC